MQYVVRIPRLPELSAAFKRAPEVTRRATAEAINRSLVRYQATAKQLAPVDTGQLRGSILIKPASASGNTIQGSVGTGLKHAIFMEQGTGIYGPAKRPIRPKRARMLAWKKNGQWHFAKEVRGARARRFMQGSLETNQRHTEENFTRALDTIIRSIAENTK